VLPQSALPYVPKTNVLHEAAVDNGVMFRKQSVFQSDGQALHTIFQLEAFDLSSSVTLIVFFQGPKTSHGIRIFEPRM